MEIAKDYHRCCESPDLNVDSTSLDIRGIYCVCRNCQRHFTINYQEWPNSKTPEEIVNTIVKKQCPLLIINRIENAISASDVTEEIYLYNTTESDFSIKATSDYFTTVDEETGEGLSHGSIPAEKVILPREIIKVGDIAGWEWDSSLRFEVEFKNQETNVLISYDLKSSKRNIILPTLGNALVIYFSSIIVREM